MASKKQQHLRAIHSGYRGERNAFIGLVPTEESYTQLKAGETDWKPLTKKRMTHVQIPIELFNRLMELDKSAVNIKAEDTEDGT